VGYTGSVGPTGSSAVGARSIVSVTTLSLTNNDTRSINFDGHKGYNLYSINVDGGAAWLRLYTNNASRTLDASRNINVDPANDAGVIVEVVTTISNQTIRLSPAIMGYNDEDPPTANIPATLTNLSGYTSTFTVTLTLLQTEQ
jgi:hypothetical protein